MEYVKYSFVLLIAACVGLGAALAVNMKNDAGRAYQPSAASQPVATAYPAASQPDGLTTAPAVPAMDGKYTGTIQEAMLTVDSLAGYKEGEGGIAETVYIIFDPRCPFCRKAYAGTRSYIEKGYTIKWIPTSALGDDANGLPLAAAVLQIKDKSILDSVLGQHAQIKVKPTPDSLKSLGENMSFMLAAFEHQNQPAGVPVAFFIDHRTGKPRMMGGVSEQVVLEDIFGKL